MKDKHAQMCEILDQNFYRQIYLCICRGGGRGVCGPCKPPWVTNLLLVSSSLLQPFSNKMTNVPSEHMNLELRRQCHVFYLALLMDVSAIHVNLLFWFNKRLLVVDGWDKINYEMNMSLAKTVICVPISPANLLLIHCKTLSLFLILCLVFACL